MSVCEKFLKSDYTIKFINSIINEFCNETESKEDNYILPPNLFKKEKCIIFIQIPYCEENENKSKYFLENFTTTLDW